MLIKNNFDFQTSRTNNKYIKILNDRSVYKLFMYYNSFLSGGEEVIKIEINFVEDLVFDFCDGELFNLAEFLGIEKKRLNVINYGLAKVIIPQYDVREIMIEKIRAIVTRNALKERDVFDLYLLDKIYPINKLSLEYIKRKILCAEGFINNVENHLKKSIKLLQENPNEFLKSDDNLEVLLLVKINKKDYLRFKEILLQFLLKIIKDFF